MPPEDAGPTTTQHCSSQDAAQHMSRFTQRGHMHKYTSEADTPQLTMTSHLGTARTSINVTDASDTCVQYDLPSSWTSPQYPATAALGRGLQLIYIASGSSGSSRLGWPRSMGAGPGSWWGPECPGGPQLRHIPIILVFCTTQGTTCQKVHTCNSKPDLCPLYVDVVHKETS